MVGVKIESINKEGLNLEDILSEIAKEMNKGILKKEQIGTRRGKIEKSPSLEDMKKDLELYNKMVSLLSKQIKEEETRRKKNENHLIEKRVKTISVSEKVLIGTDKAEYKTVTKKPIQREEIVKYIRKGNQKTRQKGLFQNQQNNIIIWCIVTWYWCAGIFSF